MRPLLVFLLAGLVFAPPAGADEPPWDELVPLRALAEDFARDRDGAAVRARLEALADEGNSEAMRLLGLNMLPDHLVPSDPGATVAQPDVLQAMAWLERAAEAGNTDAMVTLYRLRSSRGDLLRDMKSLALLSAMSKDSLLPPLPPDDVIVNDAAADHWLSEATRAGSLGSLPWDGVARMLAVNQPELAGDDLHYTIVTARHRYLLRLFGLGMPAAGRLLLWERARLASLLVPFRSEAFSADRAALVLGFIDTNRTLGRREAISDDGTPLPCDQAFPGDDAPLRMTMEERVACARQDAIGFWLGYALSPEDKAAYEAALPAERRAALDAIVDAWLAGFEHLQP